MTPPKDPPLVADLPGFGPPPSRPSSDPIPPEGHQTTLPPLDQLDDLMEPGSDRAGASGAGSDGPTTGTPTPPIGSFRGSTANAHVFIGVIATAVGIASMGVARARAARRGPEIGNVWVATEEEADAIAEPLARIAARHVPLGGALEDNDVADGIEAIMATAGYVAANAAEEVQLARDAAAAGGTIDGDEG